MTTKSKLDDVLRTFLAYQKAGRLSVQRQKELAAEKEKERRGSTTNTEGKKRG